MNNDENKKPAPHGNGERANLENKACCAEAQADDHPQPPEKQSWLDTTVLGGDSIASSHCNQRRSLRQICEDTSKGRWEVPTSKIQGAIREGNEALADKLKRQLSFNCVSMSQSKGDRRREECVQVHSGVISMDFDKVPDLQETKAQFAQNPLVAMVKISPSGRGLDVWWIIPKPIDPRKHLEAFHAIAHYCAVTYGLTADSSCKDVTRARFVTHDPDIVVNEDAPIFPVGEWYQRWQKAQGSNVKPKPVGPAWLDRECGIVVNTLRIVDFLQATGLLMGVDQSMDGEKKKYVIRCPFRAGHSTGTDGDTSTVVIVYEDGHIHFDCKHQSCQEKWLLHLLRWAETKFPGVLLQHAEKHEVVRHPLTDQGNALRVVDYAAGKFGYDPGKKTMILWNGAVWQLYPHPDDSPGYQIAGAALLGIPTEGADVADPTLRKKIHDWNNKSQSEAKIRSALKLALRKKELIIQLADLDPDPYLLNCPNGVVELQTGRLRDHRAEDHCTMMTGVLFDPQAKAPQWKAFLQRVMQNEAEMTAFLKRLFGYCLCGLATERHFYYLYGKGANGKTTVQNVMRLIFGSYAGALDVNALMAKAPSKGPQPELVSLRGKRLAIAAEPEEGRYLSEVQLKQLTGGDIVPYRQMYEPNYVESVCTAKIFIAANHQLRIQGTDDGIWDRACVIPFPVRIPPEQQISQFAEKLVVEEGPGILAWAVRGFLEYQEQGLKVPSPLKVSKAQRRENQDILGTFLAEHCEVKEGASVAKNQLYALYAKWSEEGNEKTLSRTVFFEKLQERGFIEGRVKNVRSIKELRLSPPEKRANCTLENGELRGGG